MLFDIILTLFLVALNGFFVAAEFSIVKVRQSQLELRIRAGSKLAVIARHLVEHLDAYLSATQLGITLASLGLGWIGESVVAEIILSIIHFLGFELAAESAHSVALPIAFATITFLHIVFGELAPKSLAIQRSEQVSLAISIPLRLFYWIFSPFIWTLNSFANFIIRLIGISPAKEEQGLHSSEEIRYLLEQGSKSGMIDTSEHKLLENVFEFSDTPIKQIMVPRGSITAVELGDPLDEIIDICINEGYSRLPVYKDNLDNVVGIIYTKDLLNMLQNRELIVLHDIIRPAFLVGEEEKINILLRKMQMNKIHLAIVLDEFGGTAGMVTLEDIMEELVGEIQDEYDEEPPIVNKISDTEYIVDAHAAVSDVNEHLPVELPESEDYESVGGLVINELGLIPEQHEEFAIENYIVRITERSDRAIEKLTLSYQPKKGSDDRDN